MFTWICPQCGKEVPPHETECPWCREQAAREKEQPPAEEQPAAPVQQPPQRPAAQAPGAAAQAPQQAVYEIGGRRGMPGWLVTLLVAIGVSAVGAAFFYWVLPSMKGAHPAAQQTSPFEEVPRAGEAKVTGSRVAKFIEVTGFRITEDSEKRAQIRFLVVNHSAADIGDLAGKVHLRTTKSAPDESPISSFEFKTTRLGPYESVEFKVLIRTKLRVYELPDWQFLTAEVEITSPKDL